MELEENTATQGPVANPAPPQEGHVVDKDNPKQESATDAEIRVLQTKLNAFKASKADAVVPISDTP
eukprot:8934031-Karenia_brevis.AAC.1